MPLYDIWDRLMTNSTVVYHFMLTTGLQTLNHIFNIFLVISIIVRRKDKLQLR